MSQRQLGPRVIIAGTSSGVGKTTVATAVLSILHETGLRVAPAKIGPDFIDPSYHELACGRTGRNIDTFLLGREAITPTLAELSQEADLTVIEGVMGLFDGTLMQRDDLTNQLDIDSRIAGGSTGEVAALTETPVILVLDATATSSSLAAVVQGFASFSKQVTISGLVINNFGSGSHLRLIKDSLRHIEIPIVGEIPRGAVPEWRSRHLGLIPVVEDRDRLQRSIGKLRERLREMLDTEAIQKIARTAPARPAELQDRTHQTATTRIAVAGGKAFAFVYPENLLALKQAGAEIVFFDPLTDTAIPPGTNGLYVGGGFPEVFAEKLSRNYPLNREVRRAVDDGLPTWAECGGLMWLANRVDSHPMVGAIPTDVQMSRRLTLGYVRASTNAATCITERDQVVYGHEFHYSLSNPQGSDIRFDTRDGTKVEGFANPQMFASYLHIHLGAQQDLARRFVSMCR